MNRPETQALLLAAAFVALALCFPHLAILFSGGVYQGIDQ